MKNMLYKILQVNKLLNKINSNLIQNHFTRIITKKKKVIVREDIPNPDRKNNYYNSTSI